MSLDIQVKFDEQENKWIFLPIGEIDIYTSTKFKEKVLDSFNSKKTDILIDGEKLDYVDSTGLGALIYILKNLKNENYKIYLSNIKPNIRKLFSITELDKLFVIRGETND
jgi:anti-sigma B factor antagonist